MSSKSFQVCSLQSKQSLQMLRRDNSMTSQLKTGCRNSILLHMKLMTSWMNIKLKPHDSCTLNMAVIIQRLSLSVTRSEKVVKKLEAIAEERNKFHLREKNTERQAATRETGHILPEEQVYGRDEEEDEIVKILINNVQELSVLQILGMGGLGKTTLAQMVFNDRRVTEHFYPRIWVSVSEDFDVKRLIKTIIGNIEETAPEVDDLDSFQKKLQELLNGKRYLLVLDDVWNEDPAKWASLRSVLKVGASGASVLTTTRLPNVGSIMGTLQPYELSNLSQKHCWLLFKQRAFGQQEEISPNLEAIGKEIVKKSGGVPLAAKTLGGILRFKREEREWDRVRDSDIWNLPQGEQSILPALRISYHHLPLDLRQCFVYCAVFPKDTKMEKKNLITLWMAHNFLLSRENLEPEDVGNDVWNELCLRSFFQEIEVRCGKTYFKMHDLVHDLATSLFSASASSSNIRELNTEEGSQRMPIGFAQLEPFYSPSLLKKFVSLRVLNLSYSQLEQLPSSIGDLVHLRYLDLSWSNIRSLPKKLCRLQNLQTLDLQYCHSLSCLPKQTSKLGSLRNLLLHGCNLLTCIPPKMGSLTCLKTLDRFIVGVRKDSQLGELRNLNLRGSIEITKLERVKKDTDARDASLSVKANLHSLSLIWDGDEPHRYKSEEVLEALKPHPNLTSLEIIGFRGFRLPDWINHSVLKNVVSIEIECCKNCSCLPPFGELPCLESLKLHDGSVEVEYIDVHSGRFPSLRGLWISNFLNLKGLVKKEGEEQFPVLEDMEIQDCPVFVIPTLSSLKKLGFAGVADARDLRSISNLRDLTSLHLSSNKAATALPEEMFKNLANLKYLELSQFDKLKELPTSLASLSALNGLEIRFCCELESLFKEGVKGLTSLTKLSIAHCKMLKCLPEGLQHLTTLTNLGSVPLTNFNSIFNLRALTSLHIGDDDEATSLPEEMFKSLANLKYLELSHFDKLKELPTSLASLSALNSLDIRYCNALENLPEEGVKGLTSLTDLCILSCMMLKCLPEGLQHLTALTSLLIIGCPQLKKRCERGTGQDWHKIAHIPDIAII